MGEDRPVSKIREKRQAQDLRLVDLSEKASVAVGYLSMIENGYLPKPRVRERIAAALECTVDELWPEITA